MNNMMSIITRIKLLINMHKLQLSGQKCYISLDILRYYNTYHDSNLKYIENQ